jgi:hypothetical protein
MKPVLNIISFERLAQPFPKKPLSSPKLRNKSKPPRKVIKPINTIKCISSFFNLGIINAPAAISNMGKPKNVGIKEVIDWLPLIEVITKPQEINMIA